MFEQARLPLSEVNVERQLISPNIQHVLQKNAVAREINILFRIVLNGLQDKEVLLELANDFIMMEMIWDFVHLIPLYFHVSFL